MSRPQSFQPGIHTKEWWERDMADANSLLAPYAYLKPEELTPEMALQLFSIVIQEIGRVALITRALALEEKPRRGRPPKNDREVRPRSGRDRSLTVQANPEAGAVEFMNMRLSAGQARELAEQLTQAADMLQSPDEPAE